MRDEGGELHAETDEARGGSTPHIVRWVLGISLLAAIVLLSIIWITGAVSQPDVEDEANLERKIEESQRNQGQDIDGVVSQDADRFAPETPTDAIQQSQTDPARTVEN